MTALQWIGAAIIGVVVAGLLIYWNINAVYNLLRPRYYMDFEKDSAAPFLICEAIAIGALLIWLGSK